MLTTWLRYVLIVGILAVVFAGCGRKYRLKAVDEDTAVWACSDGSPSRTGGLVEASFDGRLISTWATGIGGKPAGPLAVHHGTLVLPDAKKKVRFYDAATGRYRGRYRVKGVPQTGLAVDDSIAVYGVGPRRNFLRAYNLRTGQRLWQTRFRDALPGPIIRDNRLYVSSAEGELVAMDMLDGSTAWKAGLLGRLTVSASLGDSIVYQPGPDGRLYAWHARDGRTLFEARLTGLLVSPVAVANQVFVGDMSGQVHALNSDDGAVIWERQLAGPIWTTPAVSDDKVFVGHSGGQVVALNRTDGSLAWSYDVGSVVRASVLFINDYVIAGSMAGKLVSLRAEDGSLVDSTTIKGAIEFAPVTDGRRVFVATQAGKIVCFGEHHEATDHNHHGVSPQGRP